MVAHVLRLRLSLLIGALRGDRRDVTRTVVALVFVVAAAVAACIAVLSLDDDPDDVARVVVVLGGAAVTLGFALMPIIGGAEDTLDPRRFAVFGMAHTPLTWSLLLAGFLSVPVLALLAIGVCTTVMWAAHGVPVVVGLLSALAAVVTCSLLTRVCMAVTALYLRERRSRELSGLFVLVVVVVVVPIVVFFASLDWKHSVPTQLSEAMTVLAFTPFGAAWALPAAAATGSALTWIIALIAVATVGLLLAAWLWAATRLLTTTERPHTGRERVGLGWFAVAPGTPGGAIAARSIVYWLRDRRYLVNAVVIPVAAAIALVPPLVAGVPLSLVILLPVPIVALFFGWLPHNDIAYDSTAVWMHIASGVRGVSDRIGRLVPVILIAVPLLAILIPVLVAVHGRWALLPGLTGVAAALFLSGLGLSSIASTLAPYPVSRPGDSPFEQPQHASSGVASQALVLLGSLAVSALPLWWFWLALTTDISFGAYAMWGGIGIGVVVLAIGILVGSTLFRRRGVKIMEFAEAV